MKKLLFLGANNGAIALINYAKSKNIHTIVTDYIEYNNSQAKQIADEYWMVNTADLDILEKKCKEENVTAIFAGVSGFNLQQAMKLSQKLGLRFYCTEKAWNLTGDGDKSEFKRICRECGAPVAQDYFLNDNFTDEEASKVKFPVVVKPVDKAANVGISFCNNIEELRDAFKLVRQVSSNPHIICERMLHGEEWYSSYAIENGKVRFLALNAMYSEPGYPSCCYTLTTTVANHIEQYLEEVNSQIEEVLRRIGCTNGYAWVQIMHDEDGHFYVIEMGYRYDADLMFLTYKQLIGYDPVAAMIDYLCDIKNENNKLPEPQKHAFKNCGNGFMLWTKSAGTISKIEGIDLLQKYLPNAYVDMWRKPGDEVSQFRAIAAIAYCTKDCDELCRTIDFINKNVKVYNEKGEDIIIKYTDFEYLKKVYKEGLEGK